MKIKKNLVLTLIFSSILALNINQAFAFGFFFKPEKKGEPQEVENEIPKKLTINQVDQDNFTKIAILRGLDKIIAKTSKLEAVVGSEVEFGKLVIQVKKCWRSPPDQRPENKILLKIEEDNEGVREVVFYGWLFSSSPSISGLQHPIYDITAIECVDSKPQIVDKDQSL